MQANIFLPEAGKLYILGKIIEKTIQTSEMILLKNPLLLFV